jgi:hypothetical protein
LEAGIADQKKRRKTFLSWLRSPNGRGAEAMVDASSSRTTMSDAAVQGAQSLFQQLIGNAGILDPDGLTKMFTYIGEHADFQPAMLRELLGPMKLALAQGGWFIIPPDKTSLVLHGDEHVLYETPAEVLKEVTDRQIRVSDQGLSIPIGLGMSYQTGAGLGHIETIGSHWTTADEGTLTLTDSRLVYHGLRQTLEFPLQNLASLTAYADAIGIGATNRDSNSYFRIWKPQLTVGLIQGAVSHLGNINAILFEFEGHEGPEEHRYQVTLKS